MQVRDPSLPKVLRALSGCTGSRGVKTVSGEKSLTFLMRNEGGEFPAFHKVDCAPFFKRELDLDFQALWGTLLVH